uniref:Uncharacterized protein n=1 Tax=Glycine max TaxID=3847 RepID=C6T5Y8_SOYBN|nr:unknown [Glycine max]
MLLVCSFTVWFWLPKSSLLLILFLILIE